MDEKERDFLAEYAETDTEAEEQEPEATPEQVGTDVKPEPATAPEASSAEEPPKDDRVPLAALQAERKKRQEYEARVRQYEQQQAEQPKPDFYENPPQYVESLLQQHDQRVTQRMLGALEAQAREVYPDYDEVFEEVLQAAQDNPALQQQVMTAPNPAMQAYKLGKQLREMKAMQDPETYRAKIEAEVRTKIEAEYRAKEEAKLKASNALPPDLSASRNVGGENIPDAADVFDTVFQS